MTAEANQALVRRFFEEVINQQNVAAIESIFAPSFAQGGEGRGHCGQAAAVRACFSSFPDVRATINDLVSEGDRVAARMTWRATHGGSWRGIPATGKHVAWDVMAFLRVRDGRIQHAWVVEDDAALLNQIGSAARG